MNSIKYWTVFFCVVFTLRKHTFLEKVSEVFTFIFSARNRPKRINPSHKVSCKCSCDIRKTKIQKSNKIYRIYRMKKKNLHFNEIEYFTSWYTAKMYKYRICLTANVKVVERWNIGIYLYVHAKYGLFPLIIYWNIAW